MAPLALVPILASTERHRAEARAGQGLGRLTVGARKEQGTGTAAPGKAEEQHKTAKHTVGSGLSPPLCLLRVGTLDPHPRREEHDGKHQLVPEYRVQPHSKGGI